jgi:hypothetical protein
VKATIDQNGLLTIKSETPVEAYALGQWVKSNIEHDAHDKIIVNYRKLMFDASPDSLDTPPDGQ